MAWHWSKGSNWQDHPSLAPNEDASKAHAWGWNEQHDKEGHSKSSTTRKIMQGILGPPVLEYLKEIYALWLVLLIPCTIILTFARLPWPPCIIMATTWPMLEQTILHSIRSCPRICKATLSQGEVKQHGMICWNHHCGVASAKVKEGTNFLGAPGFHQQANLCSEHGTSYLCNSTLTRTSLPYHWIFPELQARLAARTVAPPLIYICNLLFYMHYVLSNAHFYDNSPEFDVGGHKRVF